MAAPSREELLSLLRERLSPRRVLHTLGVEAVAVCMAARWGADTEAASSAALLHDMTKEAPDQLQLLRYYGILPSEWGETVPNVYHALTGAAFAGELGYDEELVSAVRWHATGRAGMTVLEKILFIADMADPFRAAYPGLADIRGLLYTDLDQALALGLRETLRFVRENGRPEDQFTGEALYWIERKWENGNV
ncbi:MAG: bis(5'-nucleosyl)-tetraphosphatase (symmetrical) YqeK [Oscillospiraceae bacterium]|jgi:nicotinate-nucleotide adenylyltransferase|nr:bis(5'-nucleosyl)-tetraphosphatase (symmetrical) YqeK [Oscillospiraceae bacterium]